MALSCESHPSWEHWGSLTPSSAQKPWKTSATRATWSCHAPEMNVLVEMSSEFSLYNRSREVSDKTKKWQYSNWFMAKPGASASRISTLCRDTGRFTVSWHNRDCCSWANTHTRSYPGHCYAGCVHVGCTLHSEIQHKSTLLIYRRHCLLLTKTKADRCRICICLQFSYF